MSSALSVKAIGTGCRSMGQWSVLPVNRLHIRHWWLSGLGKRQMTHEDHRIADAILIARYGVSVNV